MVRNSLCLIFIGIFFTACSTAHFKIYDPLTYRKGIVTQTDVQGVKSTNAEKIRVVIKKSYDIRPDIVSKNLRPGSTRIGGFINIFGQVVHSFELEKGVVFVDLFTDNLIRCFELAGYEAVPHEKYETNSTIDKEKFKGLIESQIITFWVGVLPGMYQIDAPSNVTFKVGLYELETNQEIWGEMITGRSHVFPLTVASYEKGINLAYADAMKNLYKAISDEKFRNFLQK